MKPTLRALKTVVPTLTPLEVAKLGVLIAYMKENPRYIPSTSTGFISSLYWAMSAPIVPELFGVFGTEGVKAKLKHAVLSNLNLTGDL